MDKLQEDNKGELEVNKQEEKENKEEKSDPPEIVLGVYMHCQACAKKVEKSLRKIQGVEEVKADTKAQRVVVKGNNTATLDPIKTCEIVEKKTGRKTMLVSPLPPIPGGPEQEAVKEEEEAPKQDDENKEEKEEEAKTPPPIITVLLKMKMHCEACAHVLQKRIKKMEGVDTVETDVLNDQVMVKGLVDPQKLVEYVYRRTRKHVSIIKGDDGGGSSVDDSEQPVVDDDIKTNDDAKTNDDITKTYDDQYWNPNYDTENAYPPQILFSDENPNSCSLM